MRSTNRSAGARRTAATLLVAIVAAIGSAMTAGPVFAATSVLYVDDDAPAGGNGATWTTAFRSLQDALALSTYMLEIRVAGGKYRPDQGLSVSPGDRNASFKLSMRVSLVGGYAGLSGPDPDARDVNLHLTMLSGDLAGNDGEEFSNMSENSVRVVLAENPDGAVLDGFTVAGATSRGLLVQGGSMNVTACRFQDNDGGGVECQQAVVAITNSWLTRNRGSMGAGLAAFQGTVSLTHCDISRNVLRGTKDRGCGILADSTTLNLTACTLSGQTAGYGGALYGNYAVVRLDTCSFDSNTVSTEGGAASLHYGSLDATGTTFTNNRCPSTVGNGGSLSLYSVQPANLTACNFYKNTGVVGGAIHSQNSTLNAQGCRFEANIATQTKPTTRGGAIHARGGALSLQACQLIRNSASQEGGAVYTMTDVTTTLVNCLFTGNSASSGAGLASAGSNTQLLHCTFAGNTATNAGSSVWLPTGGTAYHSIFWDKDRSVYGTPTMAFCCVHTDTPTFSEVYPGPGNIDLDPVFAVDGDYHLAAGSPCVDSAAAIVPGGLPDLDLEDNPRIIDGNQDGTAIPDMGCYERDPKWPTLAVTPSLDFTIPHGTTILTTQPLQIRNYGTGNLHWEITGAAEWLSVLPERGSSSGEIDNVALMVNVSRLGPGAHTCMLRVQSDEAINSPLTVQITLHVIAPFHVPWVYSTIQAAIDAAPPGQIVLVADGTYSGYGNVALDLRGKPITVMSENGPAFTTIDSGQSPGFYCHSNETAAAVIDGFTFSNYYRGVICERCSPTISNCAFTGAFNSTRSGDCAISCSNLSSPTIVNCTIVGLALRTGIECIGSAPTIANCTISDLLPGSVATPGGAISCLDHSRPTVTNCTLARNQAVNGGAITCFSGSSAVIANCSIRDNQAYGGNGGGIYADGSNIGGDLLVVDSVIVGNTAATGGGGICCKAGRLIMDNCDVNNNIAPIGAGLLLESATTWIDYCTIRGNGAGAGLEVLSGNLTMDDCWIEGNQNGGALLDSATTTLSNCWFQNNIAANGGGLTCRYGSLTLTTCDFSANEALGAGGGLYLANADVNVRDCFITANRAGTDGAGVYAAPPANCRMVNCAISGNVSRRQCGGVCVTGVGNCALVNCVLNGNDGGAVGGGLCVTGPVQVRLANSILWGNLAEKAPEIAVGSQQQGLSIRHSDIQGGVAAMLLPAGYNLGLTPGLIDQQPRFMAPGIWDDRGTADPLDDLWTDGDYRLTAASPCIDAGDSRAFPIGSGGGDAAPLPSDPVFDLAGRPRFFDDPSVTDTGVPDPPSPTIDMGPYEFQAAVWGRRAFYNNSRFDDYAVAVDASDDLAIATDKRALLPGQTPTADHYLSYARGLNGIMIDIPEVPVDQPAPRDFVFTLLGREGKTSQTAPAPSFIGLRRRAGANGADRITLAWADNAIPNANWLKVEVKSDANGGRLGLPLDDTFYFGLAIGDTRTPFGISVVVNATDMLAIRNHPWDAQDPAPIDNPYDVNRDGLVDRADERVAQKAANTTFTCLRLVPLP